MSQEAKTTQDNYHSRALAKQTKKSETSLQTVRETNTAPRTQLNHKGENESEERRNP